MDYVFLSILFQHQIYRVILIVRVCIDFISIEIVLFLFDRCDLKSMTKSIFSKQPIQFVRFFFLALL